MIFLLIYYYFETETNACKEPIKHGLKDLPVHFH